MAAQISSAFPISSVARACTTGSRVRSGAPGPADVAMRSCSRRCLGSTARQEACECHCSPQPLNRGDRVGLNQPAVRRCGRGSGREQQHEPPRSGLQPVGKQHHADGDRAKDSQHAASKLLRHCPRPAGARSPRDDWAAAAASWRVGDASTSLHTLPSQIRIWLGRDTRTRLGAGSRSRDQPTRGRFELRRQSAYGEDLQCADTRRRHLGWRGPYLFRRRADGRLFVSLTGRSGGDCTGVPRPPGLGDRPSGRPLSV